MIRMVIFKQLTVKFRTVLMQLVNGFYSPNNTEEFREIYDSLLKNSGHDRADTYFILKDFRSYAKAHEEVDKAYRDKEEMGKDGTYTDCKM